MKFDFFRSVVRMDWWMDWLLTRCFSQSLGSVGKRSCLGFPNVVAGGHHIFLGDRCAIRKRSSLFAVPLNSLAPVGRIEIGKDAQLGHDCHIVASQLVKIGNNVLIADRVFITDCNHGMNLRSGIHPNLRPLESPGPTVVEDYVWIGEGAVVLAGVTIGRGSVVGANAVVTRDVEPYSVVGGIPAKNLKRETP